MKRERLEALLAGFANHRIAVCGDFFLDTYLELDARLNEASIETGKTYTVGFAIHDDYTDARFHHVSLEYYLALDDDKADINVAK